MKVIKVISLDDNPIRRNFEETIIFEGSAQSCKEVLLEEAKRVYNEYRKDYDCASIINVDDKELVVLGFYMNEVDYAITTKLTMGE